MNSLTLKCHNSFQNENNTKATHSFSSRPPIFSSSDLELPKTDMVTYFLSLENQSFQNVSFSPQ